MPTATQGHDINLYYFREDNGFNMSPSDSTPKPWGANTRVTNAEGSNNAVQVFNPGSRTPVEVIKQNFEGSWGVDFTFTNPWWLSGILGEPTSTDNGDGSFTYTWDEGSDPLPYQLVIERTPDSSHRVLSGCVVTQMTIRGSVRSETTVSLTGAYAEEEIIEGATMNGQPELDYGPTTYADTMLNIGGSQEGYVQNAAMQLQTNVELVDELGSNIAIDYSPRALIPSLNYAKIVENGDTVQFEDLYGGATTIQQEDPPKKDASLVIDNGQAAGSGINTFETTFTGTESASVGEEGIGDPQSDLQNQINRLSTGVEFTATNEESTAL